MMNTAMDELDVKQADAAKVKVLSRPHMPQEAIEFLHQKLSNTRCYLEYGSGGSTRMAAKLNVPRIYSVESDLQFGKAVRRYVSRDLKDSEFRMVKAALGPTGPWGFPVDRASSDKWTRYPFQVWDIMTDDGVTPDLVLIDGRFRVACFLTTVLRAHPGTCILFDDYDNRRDRYDIIERYLEPTELKARTAVFYVPEYRLDYVEMAFDLANACADPR